MGPRILSVATAVPPRTVSADETRATLPKIVPARAVARYAEMVDGSRIRTRHVAVSPDELLRAPSLEDRTARYVEHAVALGEVAARDALARAGLAAADVRVIVSTSCTGHMMPALDTRLVAALGTPPTARRVPLTEVGCSAGVGSLGLASELLGDGRPGAALVVSVELCSLCLQTEKVRTTDVVGGLLFGDGAAAAVVANGNGGPGPEIVAAGSTLWPDSIDELGMRLTSTGLRLALSASLDEIVRAAIHPTVERFLGGHGLAPGDLRFWVVHPGGPRILEAVGAGLALGEGALRASWEVWERYGNVSSATVFFILRHLHDSTPPAPGDLGLMVAFGPGVSCELVLLRWGDGLG